MGKSNGFTLIEVLIALAILAIGLVALIKVAGQCIRTTTQLKEKLAAHWVAMNVLTRLQVGLLAADQSELSGDENMWGENWHWKLTMSSRPSFSDRFAVIKVMPQNSEHVVEQLSGPVRDVAKTQ